MLAGDPWAWLRTTLPRRPGQLRHSAVKRSRRRSEIRPRAGGVVHRVGFVEDRAQAVERPPAEGLVEAAQVALDRPRREVVDDVAFAAGGGAPAELAVRTQGEGA